MKEIGLLKNRSTHWEYINLQDKFGSWLTHITLLMLDLDLGQLIFTKRTVFLKSSTNFTENTTLRVARVQNKSYWNFLYAYIQ